MFDESLYDYLQIGIIQHFKSSSKTTEEIHQSLDSLGYRVGYSLIEKLAPDTVRFTDDISIMKYLCKDYWTALFSKQIDNLRTNNSGIFVLQDNSFRLLAQISNEEESNEVSQLIASFACGLLRGTLANFGYSNVVTADLITLPCCKFTINIISNRAAVGTGSAQGSGSGTVKQGQKTF